MSQQTQIDAIKAELDGAKAEIIVTQNDVKTLAAVLTTQTANIAALNAQIADLKAQQPTLDLTGLQQVADDLTDVATQGQKLADDAIAGLTSSTAPATA